MGLTQKLGTIPLAILTDTSNNVGIGGSPSGTYKFEVTGTAKVSSTLLVSGAATFSSSVGIGSSISAWGANWKPLQMGSYGAFISGRTDDNSMFIGNNVYFDGTNWIGTTTGYATQMFFNSSGDTTFRNISATAGLATGFNTTMTIKAAGNVGIGVTSPSSKLEVRVAAESPATGAVALIAGTSNGNNDIFRWYDGTTQLGVFKNSGNVGIGTSSPSQKLTIGATNGYPIIDFYNSGTGFGDIGYNAGTSTFNLSSYSTTPLAFYTNGSERMRITSGGNVLINGTTVQNSGTGRGNLTINGTTSILNLSISDTNGGYLYHGGTDMLLVNAKNGAQLFYTNDTERMRIKSNGDIKIQTGNLLGWSDYSAGSTGVGIVGSGENLLVYSSGSERMRITSGGNVLIGGTTDYGIKCQVYGVVASVNNAVASYASSNATTYGWFNSGGGTLVLTNSGVANVGQFSMATGVYTPTSDKNKKKDFEDSIIGLKEILMLKPTLYRMKSQDKSSNKELGFIAQEVKDCIPQAYVESGDFIGLNFNPIVAALVKSVQEQQAQIEELKALIAAK